MKAFRQFVTSHAVIAALFCSTWALFPCLSPAQVIDNCSSGVVDFENGVEETVCIYGDATSLTASAEVDNNVPGYPDDFITYAQGVGVQATLYKGASLIWDSGDQRNQYSGYMSVEYEITPNMGVDYSLNTNVDEFICYTGDWCFTNYYWESLPGLGTSASAPSGIEGFLNPKYVVVAVTYAPPGSDSYVSYSQTTSVGNTISLKDSFESDIGYSVSVQLSEIFKGSVVSGKRSLTRTSSTDYIQGSSSETSTTLSKSTSLTYQTPGTPTFSPVNSDYDYIWLWLNPEVLVGYVPPSGGNPAAIQWQGYAFDPNDLSGTQGPDIFPVQVGCLNGHVSCPSSLTWFNGIEAPGSYVSSGTLARSWQSTANGYKWPTGEFSGLTFDDVCQILTYDVLASMPGQCPIQNNYTMFTGFPQTTSDGRFTIGSFPPNPIPYVPGALTTKYTLSQENTESYARGATNTVKQAFSLENSFNIDFLSAWDGTYTTKENQTLTFSNSWLDTLTRTTTLTDSLSITGPPVPPPPYDGPDQFIYYQDNLFGTFAFLPN